MKAAFGLHRGVAAARLHQGEQLPIQAAALWRTGVYEARMLASYVGDPARLTPLQMDALRDLTSAAAAKRLGSRA